MHERQILRKPNLEARLLRDIERRLELAEITDVPTVQVVSLDQDDQNGCNWDAKFTAASETDRHIRAAVNHLKVRYNIA